MTCDKNLQYSRVFDVTNAYKTAPIHRITDEGADQFCGSLEMTCCPADSGLFKSLNHYWQNINSTENYSSNLSDWVTMMLRVLIQGREIWDDRGKAILKKASISESFRKRIV
jgi:hypothetical protein